MIKYSEELIQRTIKCFAEENDHHIDEGKASEYLDSTGELYSAFADMVAYKIEPKENNEV